MFYFIFQTINSIIYLEGRAIMCEIYPGNLYPKMNIGILIVYSNRMGVKIYFNYVKLIQRSIGFRILYMSWNIYSKFHFFSSLKSPGKSSLAHKTKVKQYALKILSVPSENISRSPSRRPMYVAWKSVTRVAVGLDSRNLPSW